MNPIVKYHNDEVKSSEVWYKDAVFHRINGPAVIEWNVNGTLKCEKWFQFDSLHNVNGPAIKLYEDGTCTEEYWYYENRKHRLDGPAYTKYLNGISYSSWWVNDKCVDTDVNELIAYFVLPPKYENWNREQILLIKLFLSW